LNEAILYAFISETLINKAVEVKKVYEL